MSFKVERALDVFVETVATQNVSNKNVELRGKNGFKLFPKGIAHIIRNEMLAGYSLSIKYKRIMKKF